MTRYLRALGKRLSGEAVLSNARSLLRTLGKSIKRGKEAAIRAQLPIWRRDANRRNPPAQQAADPVSLHTLRDIVHEARGDRLTRTERMALDIFTVAFATMSRVGEVASVLVDDVAPGGGAITLRPKTHAKTWLKLTKRVADTQGLRAAEILERYRKEARRTGNKALFTGRGGKQLSTAKITAKLRKVSLKLGFNIRLTAHSARKGAAVEALLAGVPLPVIQALGAWKDLNTLQAYIGEAVRRTTPLLSLLGNRKGKEEIGERTGWNRRLKRTKRNKEWEESRLKKKV